MAGFTYSKSIMRYRDDRGRFIPDAEIRSAVDQVARHASDTMARLAERLRTGQLTPEGFAGAMWGEIKLANVATAMAAHGGRAALSKADWLAVARDVKAEYRYLGQWTVDIASGKVPLDGRLATRAALYGQNAISGYETARLRAAAHDGTAREVRNVLGSHESCAGCSAAQRLGWVPLDQMSRPGSRDCVSNCRCTLIYRQVSARQQQEAA